MNEKSYLPQVGDIILVKGNSWISKAIQFFMRIYRKRKGLSSNIVLTSHAAVIIDLWGVLMVSEANAHGIEAVYSIDEYVKNHKIIVKIVDCPIHPDFSKIAAAYFINPHRYDFLNFFYQMILIWTGHWIGPKKYKATHRLYCSEYVALVLDECYGLYDGQTWDKNPLDIDLTPRLITIYKNF